MSDAKRGATLRQTAEMLVRSHRLRKYATLQLIHQFESAAFCLDVDRGVAPMDCDEDAVFDRIAELWWAMSEDERAAAESVCWHMDSMQTEIRDRETAALIQEAS